MNLTDQQWLLVSPLLNDHTPPANRGRPTLDPRPILDAILWKIRNNAPWSTMPTCYPSHQSVYRRYQQWGRDGLLNQVFLALYKDLHHRGRFDPLRAIHEGMITITHNDDHYRILADADLLDTWELSTSLVIIQLALKRLKRTYI